MSRCIVTGLGWRGLHWVRALNEHPECEIVACVEPVEENRRRAVEEGLVAREAIHASLDEALAATQADFVMDVTPPRVHHEVAEKAFAAGLHVLGEKPLSDDFATARRVVEAGTASGLRHMITQNYRFGDGARTMRKAVAECVIGPPGGCDIRFYMPWADFSYVTHYATEPYMFINDMLIHHCDMMRYVLGQEPQSVQAITWNQAWGWHRGDAAHAIVFRYASGLVATHVACGCAVGSISSWNGDWRVEGPQGSLDWDANGIRHSHLHHAPQGEGPVKGREVPLLPTPPAERAILDEFLASIREGREPECSARDNLNSMAMVFAAIQSAKEGRVVKLEELA